MPDPAEALRVCAKLLRPKSGRIVITQTFQNRSMFCFHRIKPLLKYITTIDFGQLVFHHEIQKIIEQADINIVEDNPIRDSIDNMWQTARMIVLKPWDILIISFLVSFYTIFVKDIHWYIYI